MYSIGCILTSDYRHQGCKDTSWDVLSNPGGYTDPGSNNKGCMYIRT